MRNGVDVEGVTWPKVLNPLRGARHRYWMENDIEILSPTKQLVDDCDNLADPKYNDASYVLRANYGGSKVLIPGDVESKGWNDMLDSGLDVNADILVASHHGRQSGYSERAMQAIQPAVVIIST